MRQQRFSPATLLNVAPLTCGILVTCILLYLVTLVRTMQGGFEAGGGFGIGSIALEVLLAFGGATSEALWSGRWHHLVMPLFLHGDAIHIFFNMLWLYQLGPSLENHFGTSNFGTIYFLSGIFGVCLSLLCNGELSVGASGAVFGMLGAVLAVRVVACYDLRRAMKNSDVRSTAKYIAILFGVCFLIPHVDNWGHFGGLVAGCIYGWLFETWRKRRVIGPLVLAGMLGLTVAAIGLARWTFYSPQYHMVLSAQALKEGARQKSLDQFKEAIEWDHFWRGLPPPDLRGFELPSDLTGEPVDDVPAPNAPDATHENPVQPPAAPDDTPPKDGEDRQGGGPAAKSDVPSPE